MFKRHLLITLRVLLEYFDEEVSVDEWVGLGNFEVLAEHHEFIDGHDGGLMHDLFKGGILSCGITCLAIVLEDYLEIVLVLFRKLFDVEFVWIAGQVFVYVLLLLVLIEVFGMMEVQLRLNLLEVVLILLGVLMGISLLFLLFLSFVENGWILMKRLRFWVFLLQLLLIFNLVHLFVLAFSLSLIG